MLGKYLYPILLIEDLIKAKSVAYLNVFSASFFLFKFNVFMRLNKYRQETPELNSRRGLSQGHPI